MSFDDPLFIDPLKAKNYCLAGKATITLKSKPTGRHFTYKISAPKPNGNGETKPIRFVALLNGPDNVADYCYLGMIGEDGAFRRTKGSKLGESAPSMRGFRYFWENLRAGRFPLGDLEVRHNNVCGRCGLQLTDPRSIDTGLGPECADKLGVPWRTRDDA